MEERASEIISSSLANTVIIDGDDGRVFDIQAQYTELKHRYDALAHNYAEALGKIAFFEEQIRLLRHKQFGRSSEKTSPEQGLLFAQTEAEDWSGYTLTDTLIRVSYRKRGV